MGEISCIQYEVELFELELFDHFTVCKQMAVQLNYYWDT